MEAAIKWFNEERAIYGLWEVWIIQTKLVTKWRMFEQMNHVLNLSEKLLKS
jgi:hypothetical protein